MSLGIDQFKSKLTGGGARANLFRVIATFPAASGQGADISELTSFMCKAAALPASTISDVAVPFRGRELHIAGDRSFEPWTITIINDTNFAVRNAFERWSNAINAHTLNEGLTNPADYKADMLIDQLDRDGSVLKTYTFKGTYPTSVSSIDVSWDPSDAIEEFTVELQVDYWTSNTTT